jgi:hypothetical protein
VSEPAANTGALGALGAVVSMVKAVAVEVVLVPSLLS